MSNFALFCSNATDRQLHNIIYKEHKANRKNDRDEAILVATRRGWSEEQIQDAKQYERT